VSECWQAYVGLLGYVYDRPTFTAFWHWV